MDEYNEYGEYQGEFSDGFEISEDPLSDILNENDAADQLLASNISGEEKTLSTDERYGAMVAADLQLIRIDGVSYGTQAGLKELLSGNQVPGIDSIDAAAAVEEFASVIEMDPKVFAKRIKIDESVNPSRNPQDIKAMLSMLQNTAGEYLDRGPGKTLPGNIFDEDKQAKADEDLARIPVLLKKVSDRYVHDLARDTEAEDMIRGGVEKEIIKRALTGAFWEGSKNIAPLPNELDTLGLVPTQGIYPSVQGTAFNRITESVFDDLYQKEDGRFVRNEKGWKVFKEDVSEEERVEALRSIPSLNNSLFPKPKHPGKGEAPYTKEEKARHSRTQKFLGDAFQHDVEELRRLLVKEAPTTYDETVGQGHRSGFARPRDEQDETQNLLNEAAILDIERDSSVDADKVGITHHSTGKVEGQQVFPTRGGRGSDRDGMYGATQLSERDIFLERAREGIEDEYEDEDKDPEAERIALENVTDLDIELAKIESLDRPSQDTDEEAWLELRKSKITASTASTLSGERGVEETALRLASERLGHSKKWAGNAHTKDGKKGEKLVIDSFLSGPGKGLTVTEGFFEEGKGELEGFGISPDGRLYNEEGKSEGLLEVKFLSSNTIEDALNTYHDQMQMQMLVTGEEQVHFYALDKYKRDTYHKLVKADPEIQSDLKKAGLAALKMANQLDQRGLQDLRNNLEFKELGDDDTPPNKGQTESFSKPVDEKEVATTFNPDMVGPPPKSSSLSDRPRSREDIEGLEDIEEAIKEGMEEKQFKKLKESQGEKRARLIEEAAAKEATESIRELGNAAEGAARLLGEVGKLVTGGNEDAIDVMSKSKKAGFDSVGNYVGVRRELVRGLVPEAKVDSVIQNAADRNIIFSDAGSAANEQLRLESMKGQAIGLPSILGMKLADINQNMSMTVQERIAYQAEVIQSQPEGKARAYAASMFNAGDMAGIKADPISIEKAYAEDVINEEKQYETLQGTQNIEEFNKEALWSLGEVGETGGAIAKVAGTVAGAAVMYGPGKKIVKSVFGKRDPKTGKLDPRSGNSIKGAKDMLQKTSGKVTNLAKVTGGKVLPIVAGTGSVAATGAVVAGSRAAAAVKTLSSVAKANPTTAVATILPAAVRAAAGIEDDDSFSDSAMDVLEFAAGGAAVGSVIPGVGTLVGAGVGLAAGLANEAYEYFSEPDPVPDNKLGPISNISDPKAMPTPVINNIEVNTSVNKDGVSTEVTENGDQIYLEEGDANGFSN